MIQEYADGTMTRLHKRNFYEAFALALIDLGTPVGTTVEELKAAVGKELSHRKQLKDPVQLLKATDHAIIFVINKETEVSFIHEDRHAHFHGVRWIGKGPKPKEVEVDARLLTRACNRAREHFRAVRKTERKRKDATSR